MQRRCAIVVVPYVLALPAAVSAQRSGSLSGPIIPIEPILVGDLEFRFRSATLTRPHPHTILVSRVTLTITNKGVVPIAAALHQNSTSFSSDTGFRFDWGTSFSKMSGLSVCNGDRDRCIRDAATGASSFPAGFSGSVIIELSAYFDETRDANRIRETSSLDIVLAILRFDRSGGAIVPVSFIEMPLRKLV
jgi:hypothetical protein